MAPVLCLSVNLRVEVHIMQDHGVSACQIQALTSSSCAEEKSKDAIVSTVEPASTGRFVRNFLGCITCSALAGIRQ